MRVVARKEKVYFQVLGGENIVIFFSTTTTINDSLPGDSSILNVFQELSWPMISQLSFPKISPSI